MNVVKKIKDHIAAENLFQPNDRLLLAVSGGVDSVVLCEICKQAGYSFVIAHCNFNLRGADSERDEAFVKKLAEKYQVDFFVKHFDTVAIAKQQKKSIEEIARELRYEWFNELINDQRQGNNNAHSIANCQLPVARWILTAHHADDNIETVLMNFFRGTGVKGLRGILPKQNKIIRPMLSIRKNELRRFAQENGLEFVEDHTNAENDYTRNYFRNELIPAVKKVYPMAEENILQNIDRMIGVEMLYQQAVDLQIKKLIEQKGNEIHIPVLKLLKVSPLSTVMYEIIKDFGFTAHQTDEVILLLKSDTGKYIQSATHRAIKNRNWLIISPNKTIDAATILIESSNQQIDFSAGSITFRELSAETFQFLTDSNVALLDADKIKFPLLLRRWKQGDYFYPLGMQKKKKVSRFLIDQKLSLTQKENVWVIEMDKKIIWVVDMRIDDRFKINDKTKQALQLILTRAK
ncbi:tRNA lysidine(34) synthetase TilS [Ferruginibacter lapsinanis]|uniref:tRNA lysidine(34) synthetase TilS n=1 Tax=Ferruginibacter lapsinanis TaxID=563172 RepID=UPI001E5FE157|nr:tRNA lysidine(34) synthetase TilS [Ferruginibacter lapsinanis]UEG49068.1 tRNA lysidine(34) synthetase TilS [Ferruginibacter lapsinanis]